MSGFVLDTDALIAYERRDRTAARVVNRAAERGERLAVPAGVVGQVWRDGRRQAELATLLSSPLIDIVVLDDFAARAAGQLCGVTRTADVIDASVVLCARSRRATIVTSDPEDMRRLAPEVALLVV